MRMHRGQPRRARFALAATVVALATAGSAAAFQALPPGSQVNDDPAAGINKAFSVSGEDPTNADVVGGALTAGKPAVPWAIFRQEEAERIRRPGVLALVCERRMDDSRQRHRRRQVERKPAVPGLAQLRPGPGRRGAVDRLRGRGPDGPVGDVVREHDRHRLRREQRVRQPLRQHRRPESGQVDLRRSEPRQRGRRPGRPLAEHPHQPGRREPGLWPAAPPSIRPSRAHG